VVGAEGETASLWLEKEQMQALSLALKQMLGQLEYNSVPPAADAGGFPVTANYDFRVGRMGMGFSPSDRTVVLYLYEVGLEDDDEPTLRVHITQEHCASLGAQLDEIIAGGRPICPLCGLAIDTAGHSCVRSNGHSKQPIPDEEHDDDGA
jgi:uncharacterized repeat protein (TIGR03847 family)